MLCMEYKVDAMLWVCAVAMIAYPALAHVAGTGMYNCLTVEPVLKDCPIGHKNVVSQNRWSLVTGSVTFIEM